VPQQGSSVKSADIMEIEAIKPLADFCWHVLEGNLVWGGAALSIKSNLILVPD
jgi:hypothetical protein